MITIQCTKKLSEELPVALSPDKLSNIQPLYGWHAHLFLFKRRKCVMVMNNETRYNFVLYGLKKEDFKRLGDLIVDGIAENLHQDKISQTLVDRYLEGVSEIQFAPTSERSIISQLNENIRAAVFWMEKDMVEYGNLNINELNRKLNRFVMLRLPLSYSGETMRVALQSYKLDKRNYSLKFQKCCHCTENRGRNSLYRGQYPPF